MCCAQRSNYHLTCLAIISNFIVDLIFSTFQGTLWADREYILKSFRQEKSYIHQDYATLVTKIVINGVW